MSFEGGRLLWLQYIANNNMIQFIFSKHIIAGVETPVQPGVNDYNIVILTIIVQMEILLIPRSTPTKCTLTHTR